MRKKTIGPEMKKTRRLRVFWTLIMESFGPTIQKRISGMMPMWLDSRDSVTRDVEKVKVEGTAVPFAEGSNQ